MKVFEQDPDEIELYSVDWTKWLQPSDTVATSTWKATGLTSSGETLGPSSTSVRITGGTAGSSYEVVNTVVSTAGLKGIHTFGVTMIEKGN